MDPVNDMHVNGKTTLNELMKQFNETGGFTAKKLGTASEIMQKMEADKCFKFLSFPSDLVAAGSRGIILDFVKEKKFDCIITTAGTVSHDLIRIWTDYFHGSFDADDKELHQQGINRLGNIYIPNESYGELLEKRLIPILQKIYDEGNKNLATWELCREIGKHLENEPKKGESILYHAYKNNIPIIIPGPTDGALGFQIHMFKQDHDMTIDVFKDEKLLEEMVFANEKSGALMLGGGISKHHVIWWNQFKDGLDYVVYITTAVEHDGSLSGARLKEAVSWGKIKEDAKYITVEGDATILLPLLAATF